LKQTYLNSPWYQRDKAQLLKELVARYSPDWELINEIEQEDSYDGGRPLYWWKYHVMPKRKKGIFVSKEEAAL
jgi:hypothetical protein